MDKRLHDRLIQAAKSTLGVKKEHFWLLRNKDIVLRNLEERIQYGIDRRRGKKHRVFPWERSVSLGCAISTAWWYNAGVCYDWLLVNPDCPLNRRGVECYEMLSLPPSRTPQTIFKFIEDHGDPRNHKGYRAWRSAESIKVL